MNPLLNVKLSYNNEKHKKSPRYINIKTSNVVNSNKVESIIEQFSIIENYYKNNKYIDGYLIDIEYNDIISKSGRVKEFLRKDTDKDSNGSVVGARFTNDSDDNKNHIITHYVDRKSFESNLKKTKATLDLIRQKFDGHLEAIAFNKPNSTIDCSIYDYDDETMRQMCADLSVIENISVPYFEQIGTRTENIVLTFYETEKSVRDILYIAGIDDYKGLVNYYGKNTISVNYATYLSLTEEIPYLISMAFVDLSKIRINEKGEIVRRKELTIPKPTNEPVIGVIDCMFDENVYFSEWVSNEDYYLDEVEKMTKVSSRTHGTEVTSIIVDGPSLNPWLDDGCGRFRVKHFGVCDKKISIIRLVRKIRKIVEDNGDIHVWNLSLGTDEEVSKNFISYDGSFLDEIQANNNCIFVISGTNDEREIKKDVIRVGSPADSLNSLVVNSVKRNGLPASYSRNGEVLSFFNKPDVSYYGGDIGEEINVFHPKKGVVKDMGTSFAAPWISRKLCYLIDVMKLPKEIAKALIIDSSAGWNYKTNGYKYKNIIGYGIVPIKIGDILKTKNDEIKFCLFGQSKSYKTSNYSIPIPKDKNGKYPFIAKATLCYFPQTSRNQGVDYTNKELSIQFGRVKPDGTILDINDNTQDNEHTYNDERKSRNNFRKWENTKHIAKILKRKESFVSYKDRAWGVCITAKNRLTDFAKDNVNFGVIVTLKEIYGVNRIDEFKTLCNIKQIIVNEIEEDNKINVYNKAQEEIKFE